LQFAAMQMKPTRRHLLPFCVSALVLPTEMARWAKVIADANIGVQ
jgi:hypothetical protein